MERILSMDIIEKELMMQPQWRIISGFGGAYEISREGEVRSWRRRGAEKEAKKPRLLVPFLRERGQGETGRARFVKLTDADGRTHDVKVLHLMVNTWLGGPRDGLVPYHKNGDLNDHNVNNIGFTTRQLLGKATGGTGKRIPIAKIAPSGEVVALYPSAHAAGRANHVSSQAILNRCNGKVKKPFALDGHNYRFER